MRDWERWCLDRSSFSLPSPQHSVCMCCAAISTLDTSSLLQLWVINSVVSYIAMVLNSWLAGLKEPRYQFLGQMAHMAAVLTISLPATAIWGVKGLILGGLCSTHSTPPPCSTSSARRIGICPRAIAANSVISREPGCPQPGMHYGDLRAEDGPALWLEKSA